MQPHARLKQVCWITAMLLVTISLSFLLTTRVFARLPIHVTPYYARIKVVAFDGSAKNPSGRVFEERTLAQREDGARATISTFFGIANEHTAKRVDFPNGLMVRSVPAVKLKATAQFTSDELLKHRNALLNPPRDCHLTPNASVIGTDSILGQRVFVLRDNAYNKLGRRFTNYLAPNLTCVVLRWDVEQRQPDGTYKLVSQGRVEQIEVGKTHQDLFALDTDYREAPPSVIEERFLTNANRLDLLEKDCTECSAQRKRNDEWYRSHGPDIFTGK